MNFALFLFLLLSVTGLVWLLDKFVLRKNRSKEAKQPWWVEYSVSFFPVILVVFLLRSFLVEPFKIPSGSMIPTLLIGDFILVNKYTYGIRLPVLNVKVVDLNSPKRGDVMVFRYPADPSLDYIKRVVGLPGDRIEYRDKQLCDQRRAGAAAAAAATTSRASGCSSFRATSRASTTPGTRSSWRRRRPDSSAAGHGLRPFRQLRLQ